jgi:hypothetical protein
MAAAIFMACCRPSNTCGKTNAPDAASFDALHEQRRGNGHGIASLQKLALSARREWMALLTRTGTSSRHRVSLSCVLDSLRR